MLLSPSILYSCTEMETQTVTVHDVLTTTVAVTEMPNDVILELLSEAKDLQFVWMVIAIVFLVIAIIAVVVSVFLGCFFCMKVKLKMNHNVGAMMYNENTGTPLHEGVLCNCYITTYYAHVQIFQCSKKNDHCPHK